MEPPVDFTPSVYEHAASLIGKSPLEVSQNPGLLFEAHAEAYRLYRHSPVVIGIDIYNLEAEAYGAILSRPVGNGIPAVEKHPVESTCDISLLPPLNPLTDGRLPMVIETGRRLSRIFPGADVRIPVSGPFSLAANLTGFERLLQDLLEDPFIVSEALFHLAKGQVAFCREITKNGLGISFFESGATPPLISPEIFNQVELPVLKSLINEVSVVAGKSVPCIIGGNTAPVIESVVATGTGYVICPSETDQPLFMKTMEKFPDTMVRINMKPDGFSGNDAEFVFRELDRVLALARGRKKSCLGTGVLPYETNPELIFRIKDYLKNIHHGRFGN